MYNFPNSLFQIYLYVSHVTLSIQSKLSEVLCPGFRSPGTAPKQDQKIT